MWLRPLIRVVAALCLPILVPLTMTWMLWSLPGDPVARLGVSDPVSREYVAKARNLDQGPWHFFSSWLENALQGELGRSWGIAQGLDIASELIIPSILPTLALVGIALIPVGIATVGAATRVIPAQADPFLHLIGLIPAVVFAIIGVAWIEIQYGARDLTVEVDLLNINLVVGALVLGLSDGAFSGAVSGTRGLFRTENQRRYVAIGVLRGERPLSNTLPNVLPALTGQLRARTLHLLSGAVVVEVILKIDGLGDLLWRGTLTQDFPVMLAAASCFGVISAALLIAQSLVEIGVAWHIGRAPRVDVPEEAS